MAQDTTSENGAKAASPSSQQRENVDPTERNQPIPLLAAVAMVAILVFGAGYIVFSDAPGAPELGDRRTLADLRTGTVKTAGSADGKQLYSVHCVACHQASGKGLAGVFPPLDASEWVVGDERIVANILLHGVAGEITVAGTVYKGVMPAFKQLADAELAALASHVRGEWSNKATPIKPETFERERKASPRTTPFAGGDELKALAAKPP
jgi:mono/diheme cytochrome c family protein